MNSLRHRAIRFGLVALIVLLGLAASVPQPWQHLGPATTAQPQDGDQ